MGVLDLELSLLKIESNATGHHHLIEKLFVRHAALLLATHIHIISSSIYLDLLS